MNSKKCPHSGCPGTAYDTINHPYHGRAAGHAGTQSQTLYASGHPVAAAVVVGYQVVKMGRMWINRDTPYKCTTCGRRS